MVRGHPPSALNLTAELFKAHWKQPAQLAEQLCQKRVSVLIDSVDDWGLAGFPLTKEPTSVGSRQSPQDLTVPLVSHCAHPRGYLLRVEADGLA